MAKIKYFHDSKISIYIYGERFERHHEKHVLVIKAEEECNYGFDGDAIKNSPRLRNKAEHQKISVWILNHREELEQAWEDVNNGIKPAMIQD